MIQTAAYAKQIGQKLRKDPELIRATLQQRSRKSLFFLAKAVLGYTDLTSELHRQMCYFAQDPTVKRRLMEVPRGHLKTTIATISKPIWRFIQIPDPPTFWGPDETIGLAMSGAAVATSKLLEIQRHFESNILFRWLFTDIVPEDFGKTIWNQESMRIAGVSTAKPSIRILGVDTKVTGLHFRGGIEDDLVDETICDSEIEIQRRVDFHQYFFPLLDDPGKDWLDTTGNRWGKRDVNGWVREHERNCKVFYRQALKADGTPLWPERFSQETLTNLRATLGPYKFSCQYMNDPKDPEAAAFKSGWLRYYEFIKDPEGADCIIINDTGEVIKRDTLWVYMVLDPAQTPGNRSDRTAIVVTGIDPKGRIFVLDALAVRKDPYDALLDAYKAYDKWKPSQLGVEAVAFSRLLIQPLRRLGEDRGKWLPVIPIKGSSSAGAKESRINQVVGETFASGRAFVRKDQADFVDEYTWFPDPTSTRDLLDAYALSDLMWTFRQKSKGQGEGPDQWLKKARAAGMSVVGGY